MTNYKNLGGDSGIESYDTEKGKITVYFTCGAAYLYTDESAGDYNIETMHKLAEHGQGLNTFINQDVWGDYEKKLS